MNAEHWNIFAQGKVKHASEVLISSITSSTQTALLLYSMPIISPEIMILEL
jgi:hypothetical protein